MIRFVLLFAALLVMPVSAMAERHDDETASLSCDHKEICVLEKLYRVRGLDPIWFEGERLSRKGRQAVEALQQASEHGFNPYRRYRLADVMDLKTTETNTQSIQKADFLITAAFYAYLSDLNGAALDFADFDRWVNTRNLDQAVDYYTPDDPLYRALSNALEAREAQAEAPFQKLNFGRRFLRPGNSHPAVPELRIRMADQGFLGDTELAEGDDPFVYDPALVAAVKAFQGVKGEKTDGVIGPNTLRLINRGVADEVNQIRMNMQRLRDLRRDRRADKRVEVSIAEYRLLAYDGGGVVLDMPVVVGKPKRQTLSFSTEIRGVRFNPGWTVPDTIKKEDYLPKLLEDPTYLENQNILILSDWTGEAEVVDPTTIDWAGLSEGELKAMRMFKPAGRNNPLGQIRVLMHNPYDIFIHDTNTARLFQRAKRAYSSGCIRVAEPIALTNFLFNGNKADWTDDKAEFYLNRGRTADILLDEYIPVYLDYLTAWLSDEGSVILGQDVYGLDEGDVDQVKIFADREYLRPLLHVNLFMDIVNEPILEADALHRI